MRQVDGRGTGTPIRWAQCLGGPGFDADWAPDSAQDGDDQLRGLNAHFGELHADAEFAFAHA